jgi:hypothetical protein
VFTLVHIAPGRLEQLISHQYVPVYLSQPTDGAILQNLVCYASSSSSPIVCTEKRAFSSCSLYYTNFACDRQPLDSGNAPATWPALLCLRSSPWRPLRVCDSLSDVASTISSLQTGCSRKTDLVSNNPDCDCFGSHIKFVRVYSNPF